MFRNKAVIVVGAGASYELGLPIGSKLKEDIAKLLKQVAEDHPRADSAARSALDQIAHVNSWGWGQVLLSISKLVHALPFSPSIDNVLFTHDSDAALVACGKVAICKVILDAERKTYLRNSGFLAPPQTKLPWHMPFISKLCEQTKLADADRLFANLTFIIFNYDRCLEEHLRYGICRYYGISGSDAAEIVNSARFLHPYGSVGRLPWHYEPPMRFTQIALGGAPRGDELVDLSYEIQTFGEARCDAELQAQIATALEQAAVVTYLGFSFGEQNMELLSAANEQDTFGMQRDAYATTLGMSAGQLLMAKAAVERTLSRHGKGDRINFVSENSTCASFITDWIGNIAG